MFLTEKLRNPLSQLVEKQCAIDACCRCPPKQRKICQKVWQLCGVDRVVVIYNS